MLAAGQDTRLGPDVHSAASSESFFQITLQADAERDPMERLPAAATKADAGRTRNDTTWRK